MKHIGSFFRDNNDKPSLKQLIPAIDRIINALLILPVCARLAGIR
jgi:hypothetical protein